MDIISPLFLSPFNIFYVRSGEGTAPTPGDYALNHNPNLFNLLESIFDQVQGQFVLGINFYLPDTNYYAVNESLFIIQHINPSLKNLKAFEIGNEVDVYTNTGLRNASWSPEVYELTTRTPLPPPKVNL